MSITPQTRPGRSQGWDLSDLSPRERANERYPATLHPRHTRHLHPVALLPRTPHQPPRHTRAWYNRRALARAVALTAVATCTVFALWLCLVGIHAAYTFGTDLRAILPSL